jgi:predicted thioesterase
MGEIKVGLMEEASLLVTDQMTAAHIGSGSLQVFATPAMVTFVEQVCRRMADELLPPGQASVGIRVDIRHLAPTPLGGQVRLQAEVTAYDGRVIEYQVRLWDETELVGEGQHIRAIIDETRFLNRVQSKQGR